jgi:peptidoglycan/LPS O-acetylase OafA/YrhL
VTESPVRHENNFNLIRLAAAFQVLVVHAVHHFGIDTPVEPLLRIIPGVPAFYLLSGYLIFQSYERMQSLGDFYVNRTLRIYPALLVCLVVSLLSVWATGYFAEHRPAPGEFWPWILAQISFMQFYNPDFLRGYGVGVLNGALWTISVELQFYVLMPLMAWLIRNRPRILALVLLASLAVNLYLRLYPNWQSVYIKLLTVSFGPWLYMFLLGSLAATSKRLPELLGRIGYLPLIAAYVTSMAFIGDYEANASNAINPVSFAVLAALLLKFSAARLPLARVNGFVRGNDLSYGLYLYHMPIINLLLVVGVASAAGNALLTIGAGLLAACLSWFIVEKPALSHKRRTVRKPVSASN